MVEGVVPPVVFVGDELGVLLGGVLVIAVDEVVNVDAVPGWH